MKKVVKEKPVIDWGEFETSALCVNGNVFCRPLSQTHESRKLHPEAYVIIKSDLQFIIDMLKSKE